LLALELGRPVYLRARDEGLAVGDLSASDRAAYLRWKQILDDRNRPVDQKDLEIVEKAGRLLSQRKHWDHEESPSCMPVNRRFGLGCALRFASELVLGEYQHRRTALQEIRFAILEVSGRSEYKHKILEFNNAPTTDYADVQEVLSIALGRVAERLELQSRCALRLTPYDSTGYRHSDTDSHDDVPH